MDIDDAQLERLRDQLYTLAQVIVDDYAQRPRRGNGDRHISHQGIAQALASLPVGEREQIDERAAIIEYDGRVERDLAERSSLTNWLGVRR